MSDNRNFFTRRRLIKGIGVTAGAGAVGGASIVYASQPALAAHGDFSAGDTSVDTTDGDISDVSVAPDLTVEWGDFSDGVSGFDITVSAGTADNNTNPATNGSLTGLDGDTENPDVSTFSTGDNTLTDTDGTVDIVLPEISLVGTDNALTDGELPTVNDEGGSATTTVHYDVEVTANSINGDSTGTDTVSGQFDVTVNDTGGTSTVDGSLDTNASE